MRQCWRLQLALVILLASPVWSQSGPNPFDFMSRKPDLSIPEDQKTAEQLIQEGIMLQQEGRLLDARSKLIEALQRDPQSYMACLLLSDYYLRHVSHFKLALRYAHQASELFEQQHGQQPYTTTQNKIVHSELLNLLTQIQLNLDQYQKALALIQRHDAQGYYSPWGPATKAWILMKLGRLPEAIAEARRGVTLGGQPGHALNILGILLSLTGERQLALKVFGQALAFEMALGPDGQPATPLNNAAEVYRELFQEPKARDAWLQALRQPDSCEHVLPSLNLAILYLDQAKYDEALQTINSFEDCFSQFPLRLGEEHRALLHLARGRIYLRTGQIEKALQELEAANERQQWFGKIGTNIEDHKAAALTTLAEALRCRNNWLSYQPHSSTAERASLWYEWIKNSLRRRWLLRRARQILTEDLNGFEDLYVRHTDSLLDYSALGDLLSSFPQKLMRQELANRKKQDPRALAESYYTAYEAELCLRHNGGNSCYEQANLTLSNLRGEWDQALIQRLQVLLLKEHSPTSKYYQAEAIKLFRFTPALIRNEALPLPVTLKGEVNAVAKLLSRAGFVITTDNSSPLIIQVEQTTEGWAVKFYDHGTLKHRVEQPQLPLAIKKLIEQIFRSL